MSAQVKITDKGADWYVISNREDIKGPTTAVTELSWETLLERADDNLEPTAIRPRGEDDAWGRSKIRDFFGNAYSSYRVADPDDSFNQYATYKEAIEACHNGWDEVVDEEFAEILDKTVCGDYEDDEISESVSGFAPHICNHLAGNPHDMVSMEPTGVAPCLTIYTTAITQSCDVSGSKIIAQGKEIVKRICAAEAQGIRVKLVGISCTGKHGDRPIIDPTIHSELVNNGRGYELTESDHQWRKRRTRWERIKYNMILVTIKDFDEPFDLSRIMFAIANPDMLRRIIFRIMEQSHLLRVSAKSLFPPEYTEAFGGENAETVFLATVPHGYGYCISCGNVDENYIPHLKHDSPYVFIGKGDDEDLLSRIEEKTAEVTNQTTPGDLS